MDHSARVGIGQRFGEVGENPAHFARGSGTSIAEPAPQRATLDERHDEIEAAGCLTTGKERHDVGVDEPGGEADFLSEAVGTEYPGDRGGEKLDGHFAAKLAVVPLEHGAHAAPPQFTSELEAERQGGQDFGGELVLRHGPES